ncbi:MAG: class I SAM-dependent methyltransferase, partial [Candidatus Cloacimonetes bacterium]|nr:class I SAM-dependent methyltransferase [Candidatus Cloacimonadota bacterium]MDY0229364.1 methyltransferase domain-containing protein [Candidatus Cloacimonadaceae bacterium]
AIPIIKSWQDYYPVAHEGLGSSYERIILNSLLMLLYKAGKYESALEAPCFGFTGISGINLVALAQKGCQVLLEDHDSQRSALIRKTWQQLDLPLQIRLNPGYSRLDYADKSVDFGFNFSALWFVQNLPEFIAEFCRVIRKNILICVPNRDGIGFKGQLKGYSPEKYPDLHPEHIDPKSIVWLMQKQGWNLVKQGYIDCPPWPDIGMSKEDFIALKLGRDRDAAVQQPKLVENPLSILPYYQGKDPGFAARMLRLYPFELLAPRAFKRIWAHHYYLLFQP